MFWLVALSLSAFLIVPLVVASMEGLVHQTGSRDVGFWTWARLVGGTCHVTWGHGPSPIVRFELPDGEARGRATRGAGWRRWRVELRSYQSKDFGFAARLCCPPQPHLRWRTPGLKPVELFTEDPEYLMDYSIETTDENLLRWLLRHKPTRDALQHLQANCGADSVEIVLANSQILLRADTPRNWRVGAAVQHIGPSLVDALRRLSTNLADLAVAMKKAGESARAVDECPVCSYRIEGEPHKCSGCGVYTHRGCTELIGGCPIMDCCNAADELSHILQSAHPEVKSA